ncbi:MAG: TonB-dependent receptor [Bacteroides sp.]|nr:TonB-dependent receptor [Bacteroides sp.]
MNKTRKWIGVAALLSCLTADLLAADFNVNIKGQIKDSDSKEPLIGATVQIIGSSMGAVTDIDGNFQLAGVEDGIYDIEIKYVGYKTVVKRQIKIEDNRIVTLDFELKADTQMLSDVTVVAKANRESESVTLLEQKKSIVAVQSVGAKELSRKGVGDAQGAVTKVSGISKQEGVKNVFVRGLGDRYNLTTLNRFPIPSEDPEYKNIALDFFSTDIIQSVDVNKTFGGTMASDVAGAGINISSKELVGRSELKASVSAGANTNVMRSGVMQMDGVNAFGFAQSSEPEADLNAYSFHNSLDPSKKNAPVNQSYMLSGGKEWNWGTDVFSVYMVGSHDKKYAYYDEEVRNSITSGDLSQDMKGDISKIETSQLLMAGLNYRHSDKLHLQYDLMMVHAARESVGDYWGMDADFQSSDTYEGFMRRQQVNDNRLLVNQLNGVWKFAPKWSLDAGISYNKIKGMEPDRRINNLVKTAGGYVPMKGAGVQQRYFSELNEDDINLRAGFTYKLPDAYGSEFSSVNFGYTGRLVNDGFSATEYDLSVIRQQSFDVTDVKFDRYYNQGNLDKGFFMQDRNQDEYDVDKKIHSVYAEATYQLSEHFIANVGVKYDNVNLGVNYRVNRGGTKGSQSIDKDYVLPSVNLRYNFNDKHALRFGASKTYTLPQAKEISPYRYISVSFNSQGNPDLKPSDNYNADLKWDFYLSGSELFSIGAFYKYIKNPISRIEVASAGGFLSYENIADHATVAGAEIEFRKDLFSRKTAEEIHKLTFGVNGAYTYTHAKVSLATVSTGSQLEGAAPWIVNSDLSYQLQKGKYNLTSTLVFNYFSDRIYTIGTEGFQDIMEKGIPTLDFVLSAKMGNRFSLSMKAANLLNASHQLTRKGNADNREVVLSKYKKGVDLSLGISYEF